MMLVDATADGLLDQVAAYVPPAVPKWLDREER
jgi:hypothetical protein